MLKVLLVKTSSLGDVVHNLPVATDIRARFPDACIDWAVEEAYAPLVRLHPAIRRVIPVAIRRWRQRLLGPATWAEIAVLRRMFRSERYDAVIDTQGLIKSALLARIARGRHHGFDAASAREALAARFYEVTHHVERDQHAVLRNRALAASALGYRAEAGAGCGIDAATAAREGFAVLLHSTSRADKLWPEERWVALGRELEAAGRRCVLPWGSEEERRRSARIASLLGDALVPGGMPIDELAALLSRASAVIGVDTGLTHLAAALGVPVAAIYGGTDPALTGVYGAPRARNLGAPGRVPEVAEVSAALRELGVL
ncbi:MAG: lipopolysaccharide heptosyltransferase I [Betaproteobacteria bacterium]|nr:lipopolysaccharide heptosyltransferase I [Betaproteobacteria bacterium]MBI2960986.1 lipopolysaccharide heptosyltransferase I [Betaproteobacteria bacterium]